MYEWPQGGATGAILQYVVHTVIQNWCIKFHLNEDNTLAEVLCFNVTLHALETVENLAGLMMPAGGIEPTT